MNKKKSTLTWLVIGLVGIILACIIGYNCQENDLTIGGKGNLALLNRLNSEWELNEKYKIDVWDIDGMYAEFLHKKDTEQSGVILHIHGGAYIRSMNFRENLYQRMAEQYANVSNMSVLTIDYRVAPEHPYPAALQDATKAYNYLLDNGYYSSDIIVAGDSAGGGLTLALGLYLRDNDLPMPRAFITMSAWTRLDYRKTPAYVGNADPKDPYISPIYGDFSNFPPMLMQVGTKDIKNDTLTVATNAKNSGVEVLQTTYEGMPHVFQALFPELEKANDAWAEVENFIKQYYI